MDSNDLYSFKLRFVIHVEGLGWQHYSDSIWIAQATDFDSALDKALVIGKSEETSYLNGEGQKVRWLFKEVLTLDIIRNHKEGGSEVHCEFQTIPKSDVELLDFGLDPSKSTPNQTI